MAFRTTRKLGRGGVRGRRGFGKSLLLETQLQFKNATDAALREIEDLLRAELDYALGRSKSITRGVPGTPWSWVSGSRPGEPALHEFTGTARAALRVRRNLRDGTVTVRVNKNAWYAAAWDRPGGIGGHGQRPWITDTIRRLRPQIRKIIQRHLRRGR